MALAVVLQAAALLAVASGAVVLASPSLLCAHLLALKSPRVAYEDVLDGFLNQLCVFLVVLAAPAGAVLSTDLASLEALTVHL